MFGIKATSDMALWETQINYRAQCRCGVGVGAYVRKKERKSHSLQCDTIYRSRDAVGGHYASGRIIGVISLVLLTYKRANW